MHKDIEKIIIDEQLIKKKITELAKQINHDYQGKKLLLVGVLRGCFIFISDLMRQLTIDCQVDFMAVSSYGDDVKSSGVVKIVKDLDKDISDKHILIVEDIIDGGLTMQFLLQLLHTKRPLSVKICTLLDKQSRRQVAIKIDYCGFIVEDLFVVGYGLDYAQMYRNLPYIGILKPQVYEKNS